MLIEKWTNNKIVEGCLQSQRSARRELYDKYSKQMYSISLRYAKNREDADDIFQQAFYLIFKNLGQLKNPNALSGWVKTIFVNTAIDHNRKIDYSVQGNVEDYDKMEGGFYSNEALSKIGTDELVRLIQDLPKAYRKVFNMYAIDGFTHREIAEKLSISEGTSKSNLHGARRILKKKIALNSVIKTDVVEN